MIATQGIIFEAKIQITVIPTQNKQATRITKYEKKAVAQSAVPYIPQTANY